MNRLPPDRVDALIRRFEAGLSDRATAAAAGVSRETVRRYRRLWRADRPHNGSVLALDPATAAALSAEASARGETPSVLAAQVLAAVVDQDLVGVVLA
ncbi:helix-turn-helix domain-containing protein [Bauldia sp.]|uniref:helix-turn-helix domain-containing protein n=1 Tax=Bauldia sp. TaxID=2575872 RepID=UPI003BAA4C9C